MLEVLQRARAGDMGSGDSWLDRLLQTEQGAEHPSLSAPVVLRDTEDLAFSNHLRRFDAINQRTGESCSCPRGGTSGRR
jgi:hypothetical protein